MKLTTPRNLASGCRLCNFAIDSGYATPEVYAWAREFGGERAVVIKGDSRGAAPINQPSPIDVGPEGAQRKWGIRIWPVNGGMIKEELYRWLALNKPRDGESCPPGYCHFPQYNEEFFKQLTAEQLVPRVVKGYRRAEWQKTRDRNEALDCRVYARAAAAVFGMDLAEDSDWADACNRLEQRVEESRQGAGQSSLGVARQRSFQSSYIRDASPDWRE